MAGGGLLVVWLGWVFKEVPTDEGWLAPWISGMVQFGRGGHVWVGSEVAI